MKNDAYTKLAKPTPESKKGKIKVKNAPKAKPLTKAELIKEVESLKGYSAWKRH